MKKLLLAAIAISMLVGACKKDEIENTIEPTLKETLTENLNTIESKNSGDYTLTMYSSQVLFPGYNEVFFLLEKNGELVNGYTLNLNPMMDMGMMMHTTPMETPVLVNDEGGLYQSNITFIMPSTAGTWALTATVNIGGQDYVFDFEPNVIAPTDAKLVSFVSDMDNTSSYFIALAEPKTPEVGTNVFELAVYKRESMMAFPAATDLTISIEPEMPSMGHGSPNNIDPTHTSMGHYKGVTNFTMTGLWHINMVVLDANNDTIQQGIHFEINL